jgi:hypothetical protein
MTTGPADEVELERHRHHDQGRTAGRLVDGVSLVIDGIPSGRRPPRWERALAEAGYLSGVDGKIGFAVQLAGATDDRCFEDVRSALREARAIVESGSDPWDVVVLARTASGRSVVVVTGPPIIGMAIGALDDPPITVIEGPSVLPPFAPGERPATAARARRGGASRG